MDQYRFQIFMFWFLLNIIIRAEGPPCFIGQPDLMGVGPVFPLVVMSYGHLDIRLTLWLSIVTIALFSLVQADPPDTGLSSHWLKLLQTNALSLTSRKLIGTGKSLGQLINIIAYEKEKIFLQVNIQKLFKSWHKHLEVTIMTVMSGSAWVRNRSHIRSIPVTLIRYQIWAKRPAK